MLLPFRSLLNRSAPTVAQEATVPKHVAIIMDGNGRWAKGRGLPRAEGHRRGAERVRDIVKHCRERGVSYLTVYAFSVANWQRPLFEVETLMRLLAHFAKSEKEELRRQGVRLNVVGDISRLPKFAQRELNAAMDHTKDCDELVFSLALSYGGRADIVQATRALAQKVANGELKAEEIDEAMLSSELSTRALPSVDLLIRTSGEARISDFLLYECAYAEFYFTDISWPDFSPSEFDRALNSFGQRERRFGLTSGQVDNLSAEGRTAAQLTSDGLGRRDAIHEVPGSAAEFQTPDLDAAVLA